MRNLFILIVVSGLASSCSPSDSVDPEIENLGRATGPSGDARPAMPPGMMGKNVESPTQKITYEGEILESINVPNYTYLRIMQEGGKEIWAAVPQFEASVGKKIAVEQSLIMEKFTSPSLSRTFDSIIFGTVVGSRPPMEEAGVDGLPPGHPPVGSGGNQPGPGSIKDLPPGHPVIDGKEGPTEKAGEPAAQMPPGHPKVD